VLSRNRPFDSDGGETVRLTKGDPEGADGACHAAQWQTRADFLDEADGYDPSGAATPRVQALRRDLWRALHDGGAD
jgi:hypothetical protein